VLGPGANGISIFTQAQNLQRGCTTVKTFFFDKSNNCIIANGVRLGWVMALQHLISTHILQHNSHEKLLRVLIKQILQGVASAWLIGFKWLHRNGVPGYNVQVLQKSS
jgi:hypothetical protein